jgi:solute carrier family 25 protein 39/40
MQGGLLGFWAGVTPSLVAAVPMVAVYMPLYELTRDAVEPHIGGVAPLVAGSLARAAAVCCVAPLEVLRTRLMSGHAPADLSSTCDQHASRPSSIEQRLSPSAQSGALRATWMRGLGATV